VVDASLDIATWIWSKFDIDDSNSGAKPGARTVDNDVPRHADEKRRKIGPPACHNNFYLLFRLKYCSPENKEYFIRTGRSANVTIQNPRECGTI
jgi:hypothetical protein